MRFRFFPILLILAIMGLTTMDAEAGRSSRVLKKGWDGNTGQVLVDSLRWLGHGDNTIDTSTAAVGDTTLSIDIAGVETIALNLFATGGGAVVDTISATVQLSDDNTNWFSVGSAQSSAQATSTKTSTRLIVLAPGDTLLSGYATGTNKAAVRAANFLRVIFSTDDDTGADSSFVSVIASRRWPTK